MGALVMSGKGKMTNRERMLHRALALVAHKTLTIRDSVDLTGNDAPVCTDIESAVADLPQRRIMWLAKLVVKRRKEREENIEKRAEVLHGQETLALKLVWLCLGGGRRDMPPEKLPEEIDVSYPLDYIYKDTAKLIANIVSSRPAPTGPVGPEGFQPSGSSSWCNQLQKEVEELRAENGRLRAHLGSAQEAREHIIRDFALEVVQRIAEGSRK